MWTRSASFLTFKNLVFPIFCKLCGVRLLTEENGFFCPECWEFSPRIRRPFCNICGKPHPQSVGFAETRNIPCSSCREAGSQPYRRIFGAAYYQDAVESAIKLFKFKDKTRLAGPLAGIMAEMAREEMDLGLYDLLVPVPLHRVRQRHRGYNQSALLAAQLTTVFTKARLDEVLKRIRPTKVQSRLTSDAARKDNVKGAFAVLDKAEVSGKRILLIDDVITTAGTIRECAATLRRADAALVDVLAVALAVRKPSILGEDTSRA